MPRTVVIHQPDFLPYIGFFDRFVKADTWVVLDHVQFVNRGNSWHYRDRIKTPKGAQWLSLSVKKCPKETPINEVVLSDTIDWRANNLNLIRQNYAQAPFFSEIFPKIEQLYGEAETNMAAFNLKSIEMINAALGISIEQVRSSDLKARGNRNELLIGILKELGAEVYLSGLGAKDYMDDELFRSSGIEVKYQEFNHPVYPQLYGEFIPYLSTIDMLFNCGAEQSSRIVHNQLNQAKKENV